MCIRDRVYYVFGILFIVTFIALVTCAETAVVLCYFQLCGEDYEWWCHMLDKMKSSSMNTAANGRTPPASAVNAPRRYHGCGGTRLGILFVRTGCSGASRDRATRAPRNTSGTFTKNHSAQMERSVVNGAAPAERSLISLIKEHGPRAGRAL